MVSCHTSVLHPTTILVFWVWAVTASLTGFIGLVILYKFNKKKSEQWLGGQLAKRYQFSENVRTLRSVIPVIGLNAVGFTFGLYFVRKMFTDYVEEGGTSIVFTDTFLFQFMYAFADIYGLIFLLTFIVRNRQVMEILMGDVRICCANNKKNDINAADRSRYGSRKVDKYAIHPSTMTDTHFEQLAQIWK
uniref:Uncharacterized protein n=1 Tax=Ditylenchus dipsaci TaxID=166011 RepID=A0A915DH69_9BILA